MALMGRLGGIGGSALALGADSLSIASSCASAVLADAVRREIARPGPALRSARLAGTCPGTSTSHAQDCGSCPARRRPRQARHRHLAQVAPVRSAVSRLPPSPAALRDAQHPPGLTRDACHDFLCPAYSCVPRRAVSSMVVRSGARGAVLTKPATALVSPSASLRKRRTARCSLPNAAIDGSLLRQRAARCAAPWTLAAACATRFAAHRPPLTTESCRFSSGLESVPWAPSLPTLRSRCPP